MRNSGYGGVIRKSKSKIWNPGVVTRLGEPLHPWCFSFPESVADVVRHLGGNLHRDFCQSAHDAVHAPGCLVDHFADAVFLDRIDIRAPVGEQAADDFARPLAVAVEEVFADHVAVDEETVRLRSHIAQLRDMLQSSEPVGRKLDFLIQEVNRECNTIGSKCNDLTVARDVVNMKAEVEKIREQVQNME